MNPEISLSKDEIFWCSDFQSTNPNCPEHIRSLINKTFSTPGINKGNSKNKKGKKKNKK